MKRVTRSRLGFTIPRLDMAGTASPSMLESLLRQLAGQFLNFRKFTPINEPPPSVSCASSKALIDTMTKGVRKMGGRQIMLGDGVSTKKATIRRGQSGALGNAGFRDRLLCCFANTGSTQARIRIFLDASAVVVPQKAQGAAMAIIVPHVVFKASLFFPSLIQRDRDDWQTSGMQGINSGCARLTRSFASSRIAAVDPGADPRQPTSTPRPPSHRQPPAAASGIVPAPPLSAMSRKVSRALPVACTRNGACAERRRPNQPIRRS